jgi:hypothetical protein
MKWLLWKSWWKDQLSISVLLYNVLILCKIEHVWMHAWKCWDGIIMCYNILKECKWTRSTRTRWWIPFQLNLFCFSWRLGFNDEHRNRRAIHFTHWCRAIDPSAVEFARPVVYSSTSQRNRVRNIIVWRTTSLHLRCAIFRSDDVRCTASSFRLWNHTWGVAIWSAFLVRIYSQW